MYFYGSKFDFKNCYYKMRKVFLKVVIIGVGFGGIVMVKYFKNKFVEVLLID